MNGQVDISTTDQSGGNIEGKESRFGIASSTTRIENGTMRINTESELVKDVIE